MGSDGCKVCSMCRFWVKGRCWHHDLVTLGFLGRLMDPKSWACNMFNGRRPEDACGLQCDE